MVPSVLVKFLCRQFGRSALTTLVEGAFLLAPTFHHTLFTILVRIPRLVTQRAGLLGETRGVYRKETIHKVKLISKQNLPPAVTNAFFIHLADVWISNGV